MIFTWLKRRRRRHLLELPFPDDWVGILHRNVYHYARLSPPEQSKLRDLVRVLAAEKNWEGCGGLKMDDTIRVTIAAQAGLVVLGFEDEYFDMVQSILVYPNAYVAPGLTVTKQGLVLLGGESHREGEAWYRGPVVLSWADALASGQQKAAGDNVVIHEFAHQLDMQNGSMIDGTPPLSSRDQHQRWQEVIAAEHEQLARDCEYGQPTLLDCYGATEIGEFFAVATECFFERGHAMSQRHPNLYEILRNYFRQDPATRLG